MYHEAHKNATRLARTHGEDDMKHVRWARIDYMREWEICTRWLLFRSVHSPKFNAGRSRRSQSPSLPVTLHGESSRIPLIFKGTGYRHRLQSRPYGTLGA